MLRKVSLFCCILMYAVNAETREVAQDSQQFPFELLRTLNDKNSNLCFSPYSISSALAMTLEGARGETQEEIKRSLGFFSDPSEISSSFLKLNQELKASNQADTRLLIANSLWIQKGMTILPEFLGTMNKYYQSALYSIDFKNQPEEARLNINTWVNQTTQGKISNLLAPGNVSSATRMVLASAIYMKARWALPFSERQTMKHPFFGNDERSFFVPMMTNTQEYSFFEDTWAQIIELPYKDETLAMLCILPREQITMKQLEDQLSSQLFTEWRAGLKKERVRLFFPKFTIHSTLSLEESLSKMGMPTPFSSKADFSGINGAKDLQISRIVHKAFIASDEAGTEAAAVTAVIMNLKSSLNEAEPRVLKIDRPFLYLIYHKNTGAILFMGRVVNPLE